MTTLLYVESSPRQQRSHSGAVARAFIEAYRARHPDHEVDTWDLWSKEAPLAEFDGDALTAKYAVRDGAPLTDGQRDAWAEVVRQAGRLKRADVLLLSVPMWNYGVPYKFKHWVDIVTQPRVTFLPDPVKGPQGLLTTRKAVLVCARGGIYTPGTPREAGDLGTPYVRRWLGMMGVQDVSVVGVDGTATPMAADIQAQALHQVQGLVAEL